MKSYQMKRETLGNSRGGVLVLVALLLVVFIGIAALAVDIGQLATTRNELQNVADAAALAGAGRLGTFYMDLSPAAVPGSSIERFEIVDVVQAVALQNKASGLNVVIYDTLTDIRIGHWNSATLDIDKPEKIEEADAVYVKARRDDDDPTSPTSKITTFFAGIFGIDTMSVTAEAIAALSGPSIVAEGELELPVGLSANVFLFPETLCSDLIAFSPTPTSCAAWHNFGDPINASKMKNKMFSIIAGNDCADCVGLDTGLDWLSNNFGLNLTEDDGVDTPSSATGDFFEFQGGGIASLMTGKYLLPDYDSGFNPGNTGSVDDPLKEKIAPFLALFDYFRYRDGDGKDAEWSTTIPVYKDINEQISSDSPDCANANTSLEIVGYAEVALVRPNPPPDNSLSVRVQCDLVVAEGRGGGGGYSNIIGSIPSLVK